MAASTSNVEHSNGGWGCSPDISSTFNHASAPSMFRAMALLVRALLFMLTSA